MLFQNHLGTCSPNTLLSLHRGRGHQELGDVPPAREEWLGPCQKASPGSSGAFLLWEGPLGWLSAEAARSGRSQEALPCGAAAEIRAEIDGDSSPSQVMLCAADCWREAWVLSGPLNSLRKHGCGAVPRGAGQRPGPSPRGSGSCAHAGWNVGPVPNTSSVQQTCQGLEDSARGWGLLCTSCAEPEMHKQS